MRLIVVLVCSVVVLANAKNPSGSTLASTFDVARTTTAILYGLDRE